MFNSENAPVEILKLGELVIRFAWSREFVSKLDGFNVKFKKGWYQFRAHKSGNGICISISECGTMYRNTQKYYRKNRLPTRSGNGYLTEIYKGK